MRPRTLAIIFGAFFAVVGYFSWTFAATLPAPGWFDKSITRWIYTTYMLVAAIFLVGLGGLSLSIRRSFARQIRELEGRLQRGSSNPGYDALPPPLPDTTSSRDHVDRDIDELLESLSEVEASAARDARAMEMEPGGIPDVPTIEATDREIAVRRTRLIQRQRLLGRFVIGPAAASAFILGVSGMMLPGADGFAQSQFILNAALILGISYSWIGIGAYVAATVAALVSRGGGKGKRK
ncbi:MAG: hypothetical protein E6K03_07105 [Methanobacteriota archaeon]|nr:MAG: hypothetical protein E6K03_07105 [Euryarchaeota archaeon]